MFEQLFKALPTNQPSREGTGIAGKRNANPPADRKPLSAGWDDVLPTADDPWDSPKHPSHSQQPLKGDSMETPAFLNRLGGLGLQIDEFEEESERLGAELQASASERVSQVLSINDLNAEEFHPMILSNINNNLKTSMDRLLLMRIRNFVSDLRQTHQELKDYLEDQHTITEYFQEKLCLEVEDFFIDFRNKLQAAAPQPLQQTQLRDLEELLRQRNVEVQTLAKEVGELRSGLEKQQDKNRTLRKTSTKKIEEGCGNCRAMEAKVALAREECVFHEQQVEKLLGENQTLQEHLFDIEQKIVGIDLEVEKRLKERTKHLQELAYKPMPSPIKEDNHEQTDHLTEEVARLAQDNALLTQKCRRLEEALQQKEQELGEWQHRSSRVEEAEQALQRREASLKDSLAKIEEQKQLNYVREHEILVAEENLSKKIGDLRKKEVELSQWEVELAKKANEARQIHKDNTLSHQFPEEGSYGNSADELNRSDEMSLKSFGRHKNYPQGKFNASPNSVENLNDYRPNPTRQPHYEEDYKPRTHPDPLRDNDYLVRDPPLPHRYERERDRDREDRFAVPRRNDSKKFVGSAYVARSREHAIDTSLNRGYGGAAASQYRDTRDTRDNRDNREIRETSPYRNVSLRPPTHQYNLPRTSPNHYRDASKNSRASVSKSIRGHPSPHPSPHPHPAPGRGPRQAAQLTGLGSKLERLREEIKKEIDSIK